MGGRLKLILGEKTIMLIMYRNFPPEADPSSTAAKAMADRSVDKKVGPDCQSGRPNGKKERRTNRQ
jgi:hypothetical protein